jgi:ADP-glucose pyrophosphorylase
VIEAGAQVTDSVLWENVRVERGAEVHRAVVAAGVRIHSGACIKDAVVARRDHVRQIERGDVVGENLIVPLR